MSNRLETIASLCLPARGIADIGTDHAYLPVILRRMGYAGYISASDDKDGPLAKARQTLLDQSINDVELIKCDGLAKIKCDMVDTVVVAGMGGDTITGILDRGLYDMPEWAARHDYKLVLHPTTKAEILRYWLNNNEFAITRECYLIENGFLCQIICARPGQDRRLGDAELFIGKYEDVKDDQLFDFVADRHIKRFDAAAAGLRGNSDPSLAAWRKMLEDMSNELHTMKEKKHDEGR